MIVAASVGILAVAVAALPFVFERQRQAINQPMRNQSGGDFVVSPEGQTHYRWSGPVDGPVIVAVHGLTTPMVVWNGAVASLTAAGFRVLTYDLYGRGMSDSASGPQDLPFFLDQLDTLLADQDVIGDVSMLGYSLGGSIVTAFAARQPSRVNTIVLVASAGIEGAETIFDWGCRSLPVVGDWLHAMFAAGQLRRGSDAQKPAAVLEMQRFHLSRCGFLPAVLASRRGALRVTLEDAHRKLAKTAVPITAIWGTSDPVIPARAIGTLTQWNRNVQHIEIAGAAHGLPYTHADEMSEAIVAALTS